MQLLYHRSMNPRIKQKLVDTAIANPGVRNRIKMAAGVVYKNRLIATGVNSYKTHPMMLQTGYRSDQIFLHAETDAIKNALKKINTVQLEKCELYVVRVKHPNKYSKEYVTAMAKPCSGCEKTIATFGIQRILYTVDEENYGC